MKRILGLVAVSMLMAGCATNSGVREQMGPLEKRVAKLEQEHSSIGSKLDEISKKQDQTASDIQALQQTSGGDSQKAQQAAADAQAAAQRAEEAAEKATKAFELRQTKGKR
jgi:uncharacterized protein (DUF3084 family)